MHNIVIATLDASLMGGVERSNNNLAKLFKSKGHQVTVVSFFRSLEKTHFDFDGIEVIYLYNRLISHGFLSKLFTFVIFFKLLIYLRNLRTEYTLLSCFPRISLPLSIFSWKPKKIIACEHSTFEMHSKLICYLRLLLYKRLKCVVTLTEHDRKIFLNFKIDAFKIPNFTDFNKELSPRKIADKKPLVCLSVGRLHPHKGFDRLLEIAAELKSENIKFIIVGSGAEENKLRHLIDFFDLHRSVTLHPATSDIDSFLVNSDVLLMTSVTEAAPLVLLEAFSYSKPVIAYDCPVGPREIIIDNMNGFLVNDGDKFEYIKKLKDLLNSCILYNHLAQQAGIYSKQNSSDYVYKLWVSLFFYDSNSKYNSL